MHVLPIGDHPRSRREMTDAADAIPARLRSNNTIPATSALGVASTDAAVTVSFPAEQRRWDQPVAAQLRQLRLDAAGQVSVVTSLPRGSMAAIFDVADVANQVAMSLRLAGSLHSSARRGWPSRSGSSRR